MRCSTVVARGGTPGRVWRLMLLLGLVLGLGGCPIPSASLDPAYGPQGIETQVIVLTGTDTNWAQDSSVVTFPGTPGITVLESEFTSATDGWIKVSIDSSVTPGDKVLRVRTHLSGGGNETVETTFGVLPGPELVPSEVERGEVNQAIILQMDERHYQMAGFQVLVDIPGVDVGWVAPQQLNGTTRELEVGLNVGLGVLEGVYPGSFVVRTTHPGLGGGPPINQDVRLDLEITEIQGRYIELSPIEAYQGSVMPLTIVGHKTAFDANSVASLAFDPDQGILVQGTPTLVSPTEIQAEVYVYNYALAGPRTVRVSDPYGDLEATFTVLEDLSPPSITLVPDSAPLRWDGMVTVAGTNTNFDQTSTVTVDPAGQGFDLTIASVFSTTEIRLQSQIDIDTLPGDYQVTITTGAEQVSALFTVEPLPTASVNVSPDTGRQGDMVPVVITGVDTHFTTGETTLGFTGTPASGIQVTDFQVVSETEATATLVIDESAAVGTATLTLDTPSWNEAPQTTFTVEQGVPQVTLNPGSVEQGEQDMTVQATGRFTTWVDGQTTVEVLDCGLTLADLQVTSPTVLSFQVSVPLFHAVTTCTLRITGTDETLDVPFAVTPGYYGPPTIPYTFTDELTGGPKRFILTLIEGEVLRVRVSRLVWETLDPEIALYQVGSSLAEPVAWNDDESAATTSSRVVFQAPADGLYFLQVHDHWGFDQGWFEVDLDWYQHQDGPLLEVDPIIVPDDNDRFNQSQELGLVGEGMCLRAGFQQDTSPPYDDDVVDWFVLSSPPTDYRLAFAIVARDLSPFPLSTPEMTLRVYTHPPNQLLEATSGGTAGVDPVIYLPDKATDSLYVEVERAPASLAHTTYWLNVRPWLVINEIRLWEAPASQDATEAYHGSFIELFGEPRPGQTGASLAGCELQLLVDGVTQTTIPLDSHSLTEWGYLVLARDDSVPGVGSPQIYEDLEFPLGSTGAHAVQLWCDGAMLDAVQLTGTVLQGGEGTPLVPPVLHETAMGRGFHIDTGDNNRDFLEQIEPSPWAANLTEVK